ncbi:MAG: tRNA pseudouridine(38-40) synthase TruA [Candidatus Methylacidiphilales bacterium]|nr:tRNA pseudouridine(38-40) synthase TruA [Candidatus Methylacidiphilales bacterium]
MSSPETKVHRLLVAYDGAPFQGWQRQGDLPTVQLALEQAAARIWGRPIDVQGSGRTDTGVHAHGQVASFLAEPRIPEPRRLRMALNDHLPPSVRVLDNDFAPDHFHARFSSIGKEYHYRILNRDVMPPLEHGRAWHVPRPLDSRAMTEALVHLEGRHDFSSFASNPGYERTTMVRTMSLCSLTQNGEEIRLVFRADGFLYRMVRNLAGAAVKVGLGKATPEDFLGILQARCRQNAPNTAPACGLYLARVFYPPDVAPTFSFAQEQNPLSN